MASSDDKDDGCYLEYFKSELDKQVLGHTKKVVQVVATGEYDYVNQGERTKKITKKVRVGGRFSREELVAGTAAILGHLLSEAFDDGADRDSTLIMGVPVNFSGFARKRLISALTVARDKNDKRIFEGHGDVIRKTRFVLEPVAVAAAPGPDLDISGTANVLIYDHGGGTLDLSLVRYEQRDGFARPVPVQELAAGGSKTVAGKHLDDAFLRRLEENPDYARAFDRPELTDEYRREVVEHAKIELSTNDSTRIQLADIEVDRAVLESAIAPKLDEIKTAIRETARRGGLGLDEIDWIVMTGGSSLVPAVQATVKDLFPELDGRGRVLHYYANERQGVEAAITDVAEGLARFGVQKEFRQIVLWDIELGREESAGFVRLFDQGAPFELNGGRYELVREVEAPDIGRPGCSFGLYERQLDRQFMFGLAEVPKLEAGCRLWVKIRPDALFPVLCAVGPDGTTIERLSSPTGWPQDRYAEANLEEYEEPVLDELFEQDAEYVPLVGQEKFMHAPLVRRLRVDDYVEWSAVVSRNEGLKSSRGAGQITAIHKKGEGDVDEMDTWNVADFRFTVKTYKHTTARVDTRNGCIRLAPQSA
jgi:hypothetical protein